MSTTEVIAMFEQLPFDKQREIEKLLFEMTSQASVSKPEKPRMKFGDLKGFVKHMADDFDDPMEDFKDYI